ncbi:MAG: hypothetical protein ABFD80_01655 [Acidobacteriota bacterium]
MNAKTKVAIFLVAVMVTLVGFNMIASPSAVDMFKVGRTNVFHVDVTVTAELGSDAQPVVLISGLS